MLFDMKTLENLKEENDPEASGSYIVYPALQEALDSQEQWIIDMNAESSTIKDYARQMCLANVRKHGLGRQLYIEHLSWLALASKADCVTISKDNALAWVPSFQRRLKMRYATLAQNPTPCCGSELDMALQSK